MKKLKIPIAIILAFLIVEFSSALILTFIDLKNNNFKESIINRYKDIQLTYYFKPLDFGHFDPVAQFWPRANSVLDGQRPLRDGEKDDPLSYNKYGYLDNKNNYDKLFNTFPEKNDKTFRIIILGGSSALGAPGNYENIIPSQKTIASILERKLNSNPNKYQNINFFQVLNFAQIGGWSGNNLVRLTQYLIHLKPDMIIVYNGFNDALMGDMQGIPYINWNFISYPNYLEYNLGFRNDQEIIKRSKIFPFTSSLINIGLKSKFYRKIFKNNNSAKISKLENENPLPKLITDFLHNDDKDIPVYIQNMQIFQSILYDKKIYFINYLQPSRSYENFLFGYQLGPETKIINNELMKRYDYEFEILSKNYKNSKYIKFINKTKLFKNKDNLDIYQPDGFHLTPFGNEIVAEELFKDINYQLLNNK